MNLSDAELARLLRAVCPPIDPPSDLERRVRRATSARRPVGATLLRLLVPYAAGVLTVLAVERPRPAPTLVPPVPTISFASIADRVPPTRIPEPAPPQDPVPFVPVPRIS